jgi:hypothetical protein
MATNYKFPGAPPKEALAFFRAKRLKPAFDYRDVWREEHATAFTVAKAMNVDVLETIQGALDQALSEGMTYQQFKKELRPSLERLGWWGKQDMLDPKTGKIREVQLGSPRRLKTIYRTNLRTARAAGQWQRIQRSKRTQPYLIYELGPSREHREQHVAWAGTTLPVDDPFWHTHMPANGWGCNCRVRSVSRRQYQRLLSQGKINTQSPEIRYQDYTNKRTGEVSRVPEGISPGFDFNPGRVARTEHAAQVFGTKIKTASAPIGAYAMENAAEFVKSGIAKNYRQWSSGLADRSRQAVGELQLVSAVKTSIYTGLKQRGIELDTAAITLLDKDIRHLSRPSKRGRGQVLPKSAVLNLVELMASPKAVFLDQGRNTIFYILEISKSQLAKVVVNLGHKDKVRLEGQRATIQTNSVRTATLIQRADLKSHSYILLEGSLD